MSHWRLLWPIIIFMPALAGCSFEAATALQIEATVASAVPSAACLVTSPPSQPFIPPESFPPQAPGISNFWYGTANLWTAIPKNGVWSDLPHNPEGYTQKIFWWNEHYFWKDDPQPDLIVTGRRLDASAAPLNVSRATNAFADDIQSAMLVGVDFPTLGCWEITGRYTEAELSFVVWVAP